MCNTKQNSEVLIYRMSEKEVFGLERLYFERHNTRRIKFCTLDSPTQQALLRYVGNHLLFNFVTNVLIIF
jgi:hypothetical protein